MSFVRNSLLSSVILATLLLFIVYSHPVRFAINLLKGHHHENDLMSSC